MFYLSWANLDQSDLDECQSSHAVMIFFQEILDSYFLKPSEITAGKCILDKTTEEK